MAVCPKCKEQVSEAAVVCPHCNCNIEEFKTEQKAEKKRKEAELAEKRRLALEEQKKKEELADRLICPDCGKKVTLDDKTCPKCGFPLDDKGERARMKLWRNIQKKDGNKAFMDKWFAPLMIVFILFCTIVIIYCTFDGERSDLRGIFIALSVLLAGALIYFNLSSVLKGERNVKEKNFEKYMIEDQYMGAEMFADLIKHGMAHCPYCQRRLTMKSITFYNHLQTDIKEIRCEHCEKLIDFPGDKLREDIRQSQIKKNFRHQRWGF
ncbi:MAG: zinc-ribbon domain-containing protein [Clostridia bacterium]|nr:zinc-ribbon domain-containing protein [Clostridia bacterium]